MHSGRFGFHTFAFAISAIAASVALLDADASARRRAAPGRDGQAAIDCTAYARQSRTGDVDPLIEFYRPLSSDARRQCVAQLVLLVGDTQNRLLAEYAALGMEALAQRHLIENGPGLLGPLIACEQQGASTLPNYCNRALAALTTHSYGRAMFADESGAPPRSAENVALNVADWAEYERMYGASHPVFDESLAAACARAIGDVGGRLVTLLSDSTPGHPAVGYLRNMSRASVETLRVFGERIFYIGLGEGKLGPGFPVPGNWMSLAGLRGIRFLMFRPGLANPAFPDRPDADIRAFPVEAADFRETFRSLDLEVRFQLVTENDELRRRAVTAVDEGLEELRKATAAYR